MEDGSRVEEQQGSPWEEQDEQRALIYVGNVDMSVFSWADWQAP